jgi:integrase
MGRNAKPWFRKATGWWYVEIGGRQHKLARDKQEAKDAFHELFANREDLQPHRYVRDLLDEFLDWCKLQRSEATYDWYTYFLSSFAATIKKKFLVSQLQPLHVTKWVQTAFKEASDTTRNRAITAVQRAFSWAVKQGHIRRNPFVGIEKPAMGRRELVISSKQFKLILSKTDDPEFRDYLNFVWETGCRPQEAAKIAARHLDEDGCRLVLPPSESKGKKAARVIYLNATAMQIVKRLCKTHAEGPIFLNTQGRPWNKNAVRCRFRNMDIDIEGLCAYTLRHTWCNRALAAGVDSLTVGLLMGHSDLSQVAKTYQHLSKNPAFLREQLQKV